MCPTPRASIILFPLPCSFPILMEACQEDNTMTESEVQGVRGWPGGEKVSGVQPSQDSIFIRSAGWATDKTTRDVRERTNMLTSTPHTPHLLHSRTPRWWQEMKRSTKNKQTKEKKTKNLPHHNSQTLLHGYSDLIHFTAAQMHHKSLLGDIWSPQLC